MILGISKRTLVVGAIIVGIALIYIMGSEQRSSAGAQGGQAGCQVSVTADVLNLRSAPAPDSKIVGKLTQNAHSPAEPAVQNGFRKLAENKWASAEFLNPLDGATCE